ncbi:MAG TPA: fibronectin type III domain-containing protein [Patescibacteria group bacterium]|nr:fibronectin type III domain-containing protein [Patescibacteria group bacterium]
MFFAMQGKVWAQELGETQCSAAIPFYSPNLYKVDTTRTSATLFFTVPKDTITGYTISYGLTQDATGSLTHFTEQSQNGTIIFTVDNLLLDATYYFRVRSENGCANGPWSAIRQSNYPHSTGPHLPTTAGETNYILWIGAAGIICSFVGVAVLML